MAYLVSRRTSEIGLRLAMGASPADVLRLVVGNGLALAGIPAGSDGGFAGRIGPRGRAMPLPVESDKGLDAFCVAVVDAVGVTNAQAERRRKMEDVDIEDRFHSGGAVQ
jgi:hypothetical protein